MLFQLLFGEARGQTPEDDLRRPSLRCCRPPRPPNSGPPEHGEPWLPSSGIPGNETPHHGASQSPGDRGSPIRGPGSRGMRLPFGELPRSWGPQLLNPNPSHRRHLGDEAPPLGGASRTALLKPCPPVGLKAVLSRDLRAPPPPCSGPSSSPREACRPRSHLRPGPGAPPTHSA